MPTASGPHWDHGRGWSRAEGQGQALRLRLGPKSGPGPLAGYFASWGRMQCIIYDAKWSNIGIGNGINGIKGVAAASATAIAWKLRKLSKIRVSKLSSKEENRKIPDGGKKSTKSTQKKRKGWAHVRRAQRSGHKTAILASFSGREKPFLFRKKVLMVGGSDLVSLSGSHSGCKPCELPKNTADTNSAGNCTRGAQKFSQII